MMRLAAIGSVAALLLSQACFVRAQDEPQQKQEKVRAFSLKVTGDGHVELTTKENGEEKTYTADSMEEFAKKYPDVARDTGVGKTWKFHSPEDFLKQFGDEDFLGRIPELKKMFEHRERDVESGHAANPHRLGVRLAPLSETLADQLGIDQKAGVQIVEVETGSLAEKSGLKKNDVLVKIDGKDAAAVESVRTTVQDALKKKEFDIEFLRQGKKQTLKVMPPAEK
jgi:membrane-associated protease RseP (regulator of RpoE activity)